MSARWYALCGLSFTAGVGVTLYTVEEKQRKQQQHAVSQGEKIAGFVPPPEASSVMKHGYPSLQNVKFYSGYAAAYDRRTRNPAWVCEHLTKESLKGQSNIDRKSSRFHEDTSVPAAFRAKLADYRGSGYDRGHLRPAGDAKASQQAMDDTFTLVNICPQVGRGFNRDYWERLETFVRDQVKSHDETWIITGPLYLPKKVSSPAIEVDGDRPRDRWQVSYEVIGDPPSVAVPTHFFKVVLCENIAPSSSQPRFSLGAFVVPNAEIGEDVPLEEFAVPVCEVERMSGLRFFDQLIYHPNEDACPLMNQTARKEKIIPLCTETKCILPPPFAKRERKAVIEVKE